MNILICTEWDNGGQMIALKRALDKYTSHKSRLITLKQSYLDYETDIFNPSPNEVQKLVDESDFFILGEVVTRNVQTEPVYKNINPTNCILRAGGSLARKYPELYCTGIFAKIMKTGAYHDVTLASKIFPLNLSIFNEFTGNSDYYGIWAFERLINKGKGADDTMVSNYNIRIFWNNNRIASKMTAITYIYRIVLCFNIALRDTIIRSIVVKYLSTACKRYIISYFDITHNNTSGTNPAIITYFNIFTYPGKRIVFIFRDILIITMFFHFLF